MSTLQRYNKPPIQEAICAIHPLLEGPLPTDVQSLPSLWKELYPNQKEVKDQQATVHLNVEGLKVERDAARGRVICTSDDGKKLVQIAPGFLAVNHLAKYPGWRGGFRSMILTRFTEFVEHFDVRGVVRIGLRYIDRIEIPQVPMAWSDWFNVDLGVPEMFGKPGGNLQLSFSNQIEGDMGLRLFLTRASATESLTTVILDTDISVSKSIALDEVEEELDKVHDPHSLFFESILKDATKELFEPREGESP